MPVTFQVVGNLADFGNDVRAGVKVRATATPGIKVGDVAVHSNEPETVVTDAAGAFVLELVSLPGVWYRIQTPYANAINTVHLAGYVPDVGDPTTGTAFPADTVINLKDVVSEDPTPGYEAIAVGATSINGQVGTVVLDAADVGADPAGTAASLVGALTIPDSPDDIGAATAADLADVIDGTTALPYVRAATLNLPSPAYIAHRGGAGVAPEETMEAFRTAVANGADVLEFDCQPLADGALALMHDATVDRTTDGTGNVSGFTAPAWRALNAAADFPWNGRILPPALLSEAVAEFGGKTPLMIEPKDASNAGQIMDACDAAGISGSVIIGTSAIAVLQAATARGYASYFWWGAAVGSGVSVATAVAEGATYLGLDGMNRPDAEVTTLVATGLPVYPYTINRRLRASQLLALGVAGLITDQPAYLRGTTAQRTVDSWRQGVYGHGINTNGTAALPTIVTGGLELPAATANTVTVGEVSPLANAAGSYVIDVDLGWQTLPASGSVTTAVFFGVADDGNYAYSGAANSAAGSYEAYLRQNGQISLYRLPPGNGGAVLLGTTQTTNALVAGALAHIRITVTPTTVRLQRTDGVTSDTGAIADTTYRGGYVLLGKVGGADGVARFKNLAIT